MVVAAAVLVTWAGFAPLAAAESGSVRYSYEQVEIGDSAQWVLVPESEEDLRGEVTRETVETAFRLLREDKGTSYGDTSIEVSGTVPQDATVTVEIDPDHAKYKLIIMAETVYTLTELGVDEIRFPEYAEGNVERHDIPFSAYTPTMPLWRAVPPTNLVDSRIRMPDGTVLDYAEVERRWAEDDPDLIEALYTFLEDERSYTVVSVLERLPKLDIAYADRVIPLLEHDSRAVRSQAVDALVDKRNQEKVLSAVLDLMEREENKKLAKKAATFLGKAESAEYSVQEQFFHLERGDEDARIEAAKQLADVTGDERVADHLAEALRAESTQVAETASESLLSLDAYDALIESLEDEEVQTDIRMKIARGLVEKSEPKAKVAGHQYVGNNAKGRDRRVAVRKLGGIDTEGARKAVESFLTADDRRVRMAAIETVEKIGSPKSLSAIADAVRNGKSGAELEDTGFRILEAQPVRDVLEKTRASDNVIQRMAYRALGPKAAAGTATDQIFEQLKKGAESSDAAIRGASARALGALANDKALEVLKTLADDSSATVRRDVAYALANWEGGQMSDKLVSYLDDDSPEVVAAAISSLTERGNAKKWEKIQKLREADSPEVRKEAYKAMARLVDRSDDQAVRQVLDRLSGAITADDDQSVVRTVMRELGTFEHEKAVTGLSLQLNARDKDMRLTAINALGETGHTDALDLLTDNIDDPDPEIRRAVVTALGKLGDPGALSALNDQLEDEKNKELKSLIKKTIDNF
jgi:HEAT repeat protein